MPEESKQSVYMANKANANVEVEYINKWNKITSLYKSLGHAPKAELTM